MASFADAEGRTWSLDLDLVTADEIKADKGLDLIDPDKMSETFMRLATGSTRLLVEVLWYIVKPQADRLKVEPEDFGRAMKPKAVADAYGALRESIADFFQLNPAAGEAIRRVWGTAENVAREMGDLALERLTRDIADRSREFLSANSAETSPRSSGTSAV